MEFKHGDKRRKRGRERKGGRGDRETERERERERERETDRDRQADNVFDLVFSLYLRVLIFLHVVLGRACSFPLHVARVRNRADSAVPRRRPARQRQQAAVRVHVPEPGRPDHGRGQRVCAGAATAHLAQGVWARRRRRRRGWGRGEERGEDGRRTQRRQRRWRRRRGTGARRRRPAQAQVATSEAAIDRLNDRGRAHSPAHCCVEASLLRARSATHAVGACSSTRARSLNWKI